MTIPAGLVATLFTHTTASVTPPPPPGPTPPPPPSSSYSPTVSATNPSGAVYDGATLIVNSPTTQDYVVNGYQWVKVTGGDMLYVLTDETNSSYTTPDNDYGYSIYCEVTFTEVATGTVTTVNTPSVNVNNRYTLTSSLSSLGENAYHVLGEPVTVTVTALGMANGAQIPYQIFNITSEELGGTSTTGSFTITNGTGSITFTPFSSASMSDITLTIYDFRETISIPLVDPTTLAFIATPTITSNNAQNLVYMGSTLTVNVNAINAVDTTYQWREVFGGGESANYIPGATSNTYTVGNSISGSIDCEITIYDSQGNSITNYSISKQLATQFSLSASTTSPAEGTVVTVTLTTVEIPNGTVVPYTISGEITEADIVGGSLTGEFTVQNNSATVDITIADDGVYEIAETMTVSLDNGKASIVINIQASPITGPPEFLTTPIIVSDSPSGEWLDTSVLTVTNVNATNYTYYEVGIWVMDPDGTEQMLSAFPEYSLTYGVNDSLYTYLNDKSVYGKAILYDEYGNMTVVNTAPIARTPSISLSHDGTSGVSAGDTVTFTITVNDPTITSVPFTITGVESTDVSNWDSLPTEFTIVNNTGTVSVTLSLTGNFQNGGSLVLAAASSAGPQLLSEVTIAPSNFTYEWISYATLSTANPGVGEGYPYIGGAGWHPQAPQYDVGVSFTWNGQPALVVDWRNDVQNQNSVYVRLG